jgi:hypothetical protein
MKEIKERAHAPRAEITRLGAIVEERREQEMAKSLEQRDATKMLKFEEQDHALNEHSQQLGRLISRCLEHGRCASAEMDRSQQKNIWSMVYSHRKNKAPLLKRRCVYANR